MAVYYKSINSNALTPLLRFVADLLYNLFLQLTTFWLTSHKVAEFPVNGKRHYRRAVWCGGNDVDTAAFTKLLYTSASVSTRMGDRYYRAMLCIRDTSHGPVSVRPSVRLSVCLSVTNQCSTKTAKRRITQITPHDSPGTLVSWAKDLGEIRPGSPPTGAPNAGGVGQNRRLSTNNRLYLENGKR